MVVIITAAEPERISPDSRFSRKLQGFGIQRHIVTFLVCSFGRDKSKL